MVDTIAEWTEWGVTSLGSLMSKIPPLSMENMEIDHISPQILPFEYRTEHIHVGDYWRAEKEAFKKSQPSVHGPVDPQAFLKVREAVCVAGRDREGVSLIKNRVAQLLDEPFAIEGFHIKTVADLKEGALLVPKVILVARHCPGRKLLDDDGDEGQLDFVYDEAIETECDIMVVYIDLPRSIYKPTRNIIHHPKLAEMVFPTQPLLKRLATSNCLITLTEKSDLNSLQKNVLRDWLTKPVNSQHPVYKVADYLSDIELSRSGRHNNFDPPSRIMYYTPTTAMSSSQQYGSYNANDVGFRPATEEHPLADKERKKKKKKRKEKKEKKRVSEERRVDVGTLVELVDEEADSPTGIELNSMGKRNLAFTGGHAFDDFV